AGRTGLVVGPPAPAAPAFDHVVALERTAGDEGLLRDLARLFLAERQGWLASLREAVRAGDAPGVKRAAHTIKGAVGTFAAHRSVAAADALETMGRAGDLARAAAALAELESALEGLCVELEAVVG